MRILAALRRCGNQLRMLLDKNIAIAENTRISHRARLQTTGGGSISIGAFCNIHDSVMIMTYGGNIEIGDRSTVNPFSVLYGHGGLRVGRGVRIAAHVVIIPSNHNFEDREKFIYEQGNTSLGITIEDDVWVGAGVRILDGVKVGKGAVLASGAVINKDVPEYAIMGGVPARVLRYRGETKGEHEQV